MYDQNAMIRIDTPHIEDALTLVWRVFLEFEAPEYCDEGIDAFKRYIEPEYYQRASSQGRIKNVGLPKRSQRSRYDCHAAAVPYQLDVRE